MGKINTYQRKQLASSAVGVSQADQSGQIIGKGIGVVGDALVVRAQEQKRKDKVYDDLAINNALVKWSMGATEIQAQLRKQYAGDPKGYSAALVTELQKSVTTDSGAIQDEEVRTGFMGQASGAVRKLGIEGVVWEQAKRQENAVIDVKEPLDLAVIAAGNGRSLGEAFNVIEDTLAQTKELNLEESGIDASIIQETGDAYRLKAFEAHMAWRIENDAFGVLRDLNTGVYDKMIIETADGKVRVPMDDKMKKRFEVLAEKASTQQEYKRKQKQIMQATGSSMSFTERYYKGQIGLSQIEQEIARAEVPGSGALPEYINNMKALRSVAVSRQALEARIDTPAIVAPIQAEFMQLSAEVAGISKEQKEDPRSRGPAQDAASITTRLLMVMTKAANAHSAGDMTRSTYMTISKGLSGTIAIGIAAQVGGTGEDEGKGWFGSYRDEYGPQYEKMNTVVDDMYDLSASQKASAKVRMANYFVEDIIKQRDMLPGQPLTSAQYDAARQKAEQSVRDIYLPEYRGKKAGDQFMGRKILYINNGGVPVLEQTKEIKKAMGNTN